jgi:hypothetical protein
LRELWAIAYLEVSLSPAPRRSIAKVQILSKSFSPLGDLNDVLGNQLSQRNPWTTVFDCPAAPTFHV